MIRKKKKRLAKKHVLLIAAAVLVVGAGSLFVYRSNRSQPDKPESIPGEAEINLEPATEEEKTETDQHKDDLLKQEAQANAAVNGKRQVQPVITNANVSVVNAYVPGIFEEGGTCTANFTSGGQKFSRSSSGFQNATNTGCEPIRLSRSDFPATGNWSVTMTYSSGTAEGNSQAVTFAVQ